MQHPDVICAGTWTESRIGSRHFEAHVDTRLDQTERSIEEHLARIAALLTTER